MLGFTSLHHNLRLLTWMREALLSLGFYSTIGHYRRYTAAVDAYLANREQQATTVQVKVTEAQPQMQQIRDRLLAQKK
jgi:hypothetical protein